MQNANEMLKVIKVLDCVYIILHSQGTLSIIRTHTFIQNEKILWLIILMNIIHIESAFDGSLMNLIARLAEMAGKVIRFFNVNFLCIQTQTDFLKGVF